MKSADVLLVVDDADAGRFVKAQTLRRAGYTVVEAATGMEALALVERANPVLIVLDVNLPDMSGFDVTKRLRARETGPPTLQILQVSNTAVETADRVRGLEQGADVYVTEPVDGEVLVATVQALLRVRRAEAALAEALESEQRSRAAAEDASRLKDEFIATLSHELRTPLNALMGWIWQLKHTALSDDARARALDSLERNARTQAQLINDLLDVSRISKGKLRLEMRLVDLKAVAAASAETIRESLERKHITFEIRAVSVHVAGDQGRLQQVVTNLLSNAVQFTPAGGSVTVTVASDGLDAVLSVHDTGAGIDPQLLPHIFDPFRQGESGLSRQHGGLGLGLAVVRQLVELHGGTASVQSPGVGEGSTFIIRLPRETEIARRPKRDESRLLLDGVSIGVVAESGIDYGLLKAALEASGAHVALIIAGTPPTPQPDIVISRPERGRLQFHLGSNGSGSESGDAVKTIDEAAPASSIVRQLARALARAG